jgi:hypothetical protein
VNHTLLAGSVFYEATEFLDACNSTCVDSTNLGLKANCVDYSLCSLSRCTVDSFLSDKRIRQIVVTARVSPYKLKQAETVLEYQLSRTAQTIVLQNSRKSVSPYIETSDDNVTVIFGLTTYTFEKAGQYSIPEILLVMGDNVLTAAGTGTITFRYREGDL